MIRQILGLLGGLAKSYIDAKTTVKIKEADVKKKPHMIDMTRMTAIEPQAYFPFATQMQIYRPEQRNCFISLELFNPIDETTSVKTFFL
jgi:hypothetical protein